MRVVVVVGGGQNGVELAGALVAMPRGLLPRAKSVAEGQIQDRKTHIKDEQWKWH